MSVKKMIDNPDVIAESASLIFEDENEKFSPEYVKNYNSGIKAPLNKLGTIALIYRKKGWLSLIAMVICSFFNYIINIITWNTDSTSIFVLAIGFIVIALNTLAKIAVFGWIVAWFAYWLAPLQHCTFCQALYAREVVFEKKIPGTSRKLKEDRTISHNVKNNQGKVIGSIDEDITVDITRATYYTVYQCKKCKKLKVEILIKDFDA